MKPSLIFASIVFTTSLAQALPRECSEFEVAYQDDQISKFDDGCADDCATLHTLQLRAAAKELDPSYDPSQADAQVETKYQPDRSKVVIGGDHLDGVTLFLDLKLKTAFFFGGTLNRAPISSENGGVSLNGATCESPLSPNLSSLRRKNLCKGSVEYLQQNYPQIQIDVDSCFGGNTDFWIGNLSDDVTQATIIVMRAAQRKGEMAFLCSSTFDRSTRLMSPGSMGTLLSTS